MKIKNHYFIVIYVDWPGMSERQFCYADKEIAENFCKDVDGSLIEILNGKVIN